MYAKRVNKLEIEISNQDRGNEESVMEMCSYVVFHSLSLYPWLHQPKAPVPPPSSGGHGGDGRNAVTGCEETSSRWGWGEASQNKPQLPASLNKSKKSITSSNQDEIEIRCKLETWKLLRVHYIPTSSNSLWQFTRRGHYSKAWWRLSLWNLSSYAHLSQQGKIPLENALW